MKIVFIVFIILEVCKRDSHTEPPGFHAKRFDYRCLKLCGAEMCTLGGKYAR